MDALLWQDKSLSLLDQSRYPGEEIWQDCPDARTVLDCLGKPGAVEGDALVACAGAYALCLAAMEWEHDPALFHKLTALQQEFLALRPHCPALRAAFDTLNQTFDAYRGSPELVTALLAAAVTIHRQDVIAARRMSQLCRELLPAGGNVVLACRGPVFHTGAQGGALGILLAAHRKNGLGRVYLLENRPDMAGTALLAGELSRAGIPTKLLPDSAAASLMPKGVCDVILIEGLRGAANGDLYAGAGAYALAIAAYFHSIPVYAAVSTGSIDLSVPDGGSFPPADETAPAAPWRGLPPLPEGVTPWSPRGDTVPHYLLTGLFTDKGVVFPPFAETLPETLAKPSGRGSILL